MTFVVDNSHIKKLKKYGINIKTKYKVEKELLERNTDNSKNDNINNGIRVKKEYYKDNKMVYEVNEFDPRILYSFVSNTDDDTEYRCPNCGMISKQKDVHEGCPYCGTFYNIEYDQKDLGSKYNYDRVVKSSLYKFVVFIIEFIICFIISYIYFRSTGRTFNEYDVAKIVVGSIILSTIVFYLFYLNDGYVVSFPVRIYKDMQNKKQINFLNGMAKEGVEKNNFFNNVNYEIRNYYYKSDNNIIDYDILDYLKYTSSKDSKGILTIDVLVEVREVIIKNDVISSEILNKSFTFKRNTSDVKELKGGRNIVQCHNCGASIDATKDKCEYCGTNVKYLQEWFLVEK